MSGSTRRIWSPTLHPLIATICTPTAQPVLAAVRLRRSKAGDDAGAERFAAEALTIRAHLVDAPARLARRAR